MFVLSSLSVECSSQSEPTHGSTAASLSQCSECCWPRLPCPAQGPIWVCTQKLQQCCEKGGPQCSECREMHVVLKPPFVCGYLKAVQIWY